jgi:hypothetical protein
MKEDYRGYSSDVMNSTKRPKVQVQVQVDSSANSDNTFINYQCHSNSHKDSNQQHPQPKGNREVVEIMEKLKRNYVNRKK